MTLMEQMEAEGWRFGLRCRSFMDCTMELHFADPKGTPHAVKDLAALERYFGTAEKRALLSHSAEVGR